MKKFSEQQLRFDLELDEVEDDVVEGAVSYEEAQRRSLAARVIFENMRGGRPGSSLAEWFKDYQYLIELGWPWRVACYIAWAASPKVGRWPGTLHELAAQVLGLTSPRAVYTWRQKYPTINEVVALMQARPLFEHRRDLIEAALESARGDYKGFNDRKMLFEMLGDYIPKSKLEVGKSAAGDESEMSDDELRAMLGSESASQRISESAEEQNSESAKEQGGTEDVE